jgi:hypothetical protein
MSPVLVVDNNINKQQTFDSYDIKQRILLYRLGSEKSFSSCWEVMLSYRLNFIEK